ncbi:thiamine pyrophosphate-binding protein [Reyranella soli]|uniref:Oxalyl-CoA decarboxylase n=1 Tax=Reyranella soli TaxID=1230389 RepID=A0A512NGJ7_9HYPH|nr:thiamine pyrophosphate-binding protein [Reyranella soli]GEP58073.1 oxalyl-CoA decarboxylase [Reyranella soli]
MSEVDGATLIARSLKQQGIDHLFGVVGFPITAIAAAAQKEGVAYLGMRNEQSAAYAAAAYGYLTGRPGAAVVVTGPGVVHGLSGLANAQQNCWPMILIGGASETYRGGMGAFQEERQVLIASPFCKFAHGIESVARIPFYVEMATRNAIYGRPGATYLDMPDDIIRGTCEVDKIAQAERVPEPPRSVAPAENVEAALNLLEKAQRPLVLLGKGMAWSRAEDDVRAFIERTQVPFVRSPMGKGVMPDDHPLSAGAARTLALQQADVIFLMGARLNWIFHFGLPPRYAKDVKVIQLDIAPEEIGHNKPTEVALVGDGKAIMAQLNKALVNRQWFHPKDTPWRQALTKKATENAATIKPQVDDDQGPANYYRALRDVAAWMPKNAILSAEGAGTMDIGLTQLPSVNARSVLNAGTYGTMGVGLGQAIAAAVSDPSRPVVHLSGDSAIGFSGMEMETLVRYNLPVKIVVLNNGGIGPGMPEIPENPMFNLKPNALIYGARYDKVMEAFGGKGLFVKDPKDIRAALDEAMKFPGPALVNVVLSQGSARKAQQFAWHS